MSVLQQQAIAFRKRLAAQPLIQSARKASSAPTKVVVESSPASPAPSVSSDTKAQGLYLKFVL